MWFEIGFIQIGCVDSDEILMKMNLLKKSTPLFIVSHALKIDFFNEGMIYRIKHPENLESE